MNDLNTAYEALLSASKRYSYLSKREGRIKGDKLKDVSGTYAEAAGLVLTLIRENSAE